MSPSILDSPWSGVFDGLVQGASKSLNLCSPYIGNGPISRIVHVLKAQPNGACFRIRVLTDLSRENIVSGSTDVDALLSLVAASDDVEIRFLPSLHAKVYVVDESHAVVTSSNLTDNGLSRNIEYGVLFSDPSIVRRIETDVSRFASLGSPIDRRQLAQFSTIAHEIREIASLAKRRLHRTIKREFEKRVARADIEILRARAAGRSAHAIFADTIGYLLRSGPLSTVEIHKQVQAIHPDLCDDSVDRVIDGRHFGKRWKHDVRSAQVYLRRAGRIRLVDGCWELIE